MTSNTSVQALFVALADHYGPQQWWPAESRFEIMIGAVLVQRTTWTSAAAAIERLRAAAALDYDTLARMSAQQLEPLLRGAGFFRRKAARLVAMAAFVRSNGGLRALATLSTASLRRRLLGVEGIGPETADTILLYAFDRPVFIVDTYALRLFRRLGMTLPESPSQLQEWVTGTLDNVDQLNAFHALIVEHGKRYCRATPQCAKCCLRAHCARYAERHSNAIQSQSKAIVASVTADS